MKNLQKSLVNGLLLVLIFFGFVGVSQYALADDGGRAYLPECASPDNKIYDDYGNIIKTGSTCGIVWINIYLDLGQYKDRFVLLSQDSFKDDLSVVKNGTIQLQVGYHSEVTFLAVDKNYFDTHGGINGIYSLVHHKAGEKFDGGVRDWDADVMEPKNPAEFSAHSYSFVISKDDLKIDGFRDIGVYAKKVGNGEYVYFPGNFGNEYKETPYLECNETSGCKEDITYVPKLVSEHTIILTKGKIIYTPSNIGQSITYPIYNQKSSQPVPEKVIWKKYTSTQYGFEMQYPVGSQPHYMDDEMNPLIFEPIDSLNTGHVQSILSLETSTTNCNDFDEDIKTQHTTINGIDFVTGKVSRNYTGTQSESDAREYCAVKGKIAYKIISRIAFGRGEAHVDVDDHAVLNLPRLRHRQALKIRRNTYLDGHVFGIGSDLFSNKWLLMFTIFL